MAATEPQGSLNQHDMALVLYARGFAETRQVAESIVKDNPTLAHFLATCSTGPEMRHAEDRAAPGEWGGCG